jgi:cobalt-zinc-cadmium efflux system outer membrane protein
MSCVQHLDAAEPLRLEQALARALTGAPLLRARSAELQSTQARAALDGRPAPYYLAADLENVAGTGALSGSDAAEVTLRIGKMLELGGKVQARRELGQASVSLQHHDVAQAISEVSDRTARRFIEVAADQRRLQLAVEQVAMAERTRAEVQRFVEAARNPDSDLRNSEIMVADAELEQEHAEHELQSARVSLAASWGELRPDFESVEANLDQLPELERLDSLTERLGSAPALRRRALEHQVVMARRGLARANARPDVNVNLGVRRLEAFDDHGLVLGASMPLGSASRSRLQGIETQAGIDALDALTDHDFADLHQQIFEKYQEIQHARTEFESLGVRMIPRAELALATARRGFERGRLSPMTLMQSEQLLFELQRRRVDAAARFHTLLLDLRLLTGPQEIRP